jgi:hypothetical protein
MRARISLQGLTKGCRSKIYPAHVLFKKLASIIDILTEVDTLNNSIGFVYAFTPGKSEAGFAQGVDSEAAISIRKG